MITDCFPTIAGVELEDVLILGSDHYEDRDMRIEVRAENKIPIGIGAGKRTASVCLLQPSTYQTRIVAL